MTHSPSIWACGEGDGGGPAGISHFRGGARSRWEACRRPAGNQQLEHVVFVFFSQDDFCGHILRA